MKKLLFYFVSILILSSCATYQPAPQSYCGMIDYSTLTQKGIFVTESNSVNFDYKAIGSIYVEEIGGWVRKDGKSDPIDPKEDYYIGTSHSGKKYVDPDIQNAFKRLIEKLSQSDANGIVNMKITFTKEQDFISKLVVDKITITGMAIKKTKQ